MTKQTLQEKFDALQAIFNETAANLEAVYGALGVEAGHICEVDEALDVIESLFSTRKMEDRKYFAAKALQGLCANPSVFAQNSMNGWGLVNSTNEQLGESCAELADAALAALQPEDLSMWCAPGQSVSDMLRAAADKD